MIRREMNILSEVVEILEPAYTATLIMEEESALVSVVGPAVTSLRKQWHNMSQNVEYSQS